MSTSQAAEHVDAVTLRTGGGAYPVAFALVRAGRRVVMIDTKGVMSGNCLAELCVPSKAVHETATLQGRRGRKTPSLSRASPARVLNH